MLTDSDWREIKRNLPKLPDAVRAEINNALDLDARVRRSRRKPAATRGKLKRLHTIAAKLSVDLAALDDVATAALLDMGERRRDSFMLLRERQAQIDAMARWLRTAAERIEAGKRGPNGDDSMWLARQCADILERHGAGKLSRSYKDAAQAKATAIILRAAARARGENAKRIDKISGTSPIRRAVKARQS